MYDLSVMIQLFTFAAQPPCPIMNRSIAANLCPGKVRFDATTRVATKLCAVGIGFI